MRTEVARCLVVDTPERAVALDLAAGDLSDAGRILDLQISEGEPAVEVSLAPE